MENIIRKCVAIRKENDLYLKGLVRSKKAKNYSKAINDIIEKNKEGERDEVYNNDFGQYGV